MVCSAAVLHRYRKVHQSHEYEHYVDNPINDASFLTLGRSSQRASLPDISDLATLERSHPTLTSACSVRIPPRMISHREFRSAPVLSASKRVPVRPIDRPGCLRKAAAATSGETVYAV